VGYAPYAAPEYVVVAVKEFGGHGGIQAVPVVRAAFVELEKQGYLPNVDAK
jgi:cell division protein FtsI/penicillin-binding protein 2